MLHLKECSLTIKGRVHGDGELDFPLYFFNISSELLILKNSSFVITNTSVNHKNESK